LPRISPGGSAGYRGNNPHALSRGPVAVAGMEAAQVFRRVPVLLVAAATVLTGAAPAGAAPAGSYRVSRAATFHVTVPRDAIKNGWCYDVGLADPRTHRFYLADSANKQITVIDPASKAVSAIGTGRFTGIANCHQNDFNGMGPNGLAIVGNDIYAGNGDSRVLGFSLRTGRQIADYSTGGKLQADELAVAGRYLVVSNSAETPYPYLSFIDLTTKRIVARYTVTNATGGLGQIQWWRHHLYVTVATSTGSPNGGEVDELGVSNVHKIRIVRRYRFATCQPAGLAINGAGLAAIGCGGPSQEILNISTGTKTSVSGVLGVDLVAVHKNDFFYVSYVTGNFVVAGPAGNVIQNLAIGASHTLAVDDCTGAVWVPLTKGSVALYAPAG
jgi:hypothetical protein